MTPFENISIYSPSFKAKAYPAYARLRAEKPVCRVLLPQRQEAFLVTRYEDVSALLKDQRFVKDPANAMTPDQLAKQRKPPRMFAPLMRNMLDLDDPDHARLKRLVQSAFTPRRVDALVASTEDITHRLLDSLVRRNRIDLVSDFAGPMPITVISELLGVPKKDHMRFARWSNIIIRNTMTPFAVLRVLPSLLGLVRYLRRLINAKRNEPGDDLISALAIQAEGDRLDADELLAMIAILLSAGHETTTNLIGNGTLALLQNPDQLALLRAQPQLIDSAVEELLRFASPVETSTRRYAREDVELAGTHITRGSQVFGVIASANRDERQFADGDRLDLGRDRNRHLTFGEGGHYCVGAALARMEGKIAINAMLQRMPNIRLTQPADQLRWRPGLVLRGLEALPISLNP